MAEDFVRVSSAITRDPPRLQAEEKRIDTISEAVSRAATSPTGLSQRDAAEVADTFSEVVASIQIHDEFLNTHGVSIRP